MKTSMLVTQALSALVLCFGGISLQSFGHEGHPHPVPQAQNADGYGGVLGNTSPNQDFNSPASNFNRQPGNFAPQQQAPVSQPASALDADFFDKK